MFTHAAIALFASLAAAQLHAPVGEPSGNPITRPLNEIVPACKPFTITWEPTTPNTVSLLLLRGPSSNVVPIGAPLAEGIANSGTFSWTPSADLEADTSRYGLQLIDDVTGQYQWSTQFGISKDDCAVEETVSSSPAASAPVASSTPAGYGEGYPAPSETPYETKEPETSAPAPYPTPVAPYPTTVIVSTGAPVYNSSVIQPTKPLSVPSSLRPSSTGAAGNGTAPPEFTGAASPVRAGLGLAGAVAGLVLML